MFPVRLRIALRKLLVKLLNKLPDGGVLAIREGIALQRRMDYPHSDIYLDIRSSDEYFLRLRSCAKEPETIEWIEMFIREGDVVYDVGANVGTYSLVISKYTNGKATVYAFEPGFANYSQLCFNIFLNNCQNSIIPVPIALSGKTGLDEFRFSTLRSGAASHIIGSWQSPSHAQIEGGLIQKILTCKLDDLVKQFDIKHPNHIKIDVDGTEYEVLCGAREVLASPSLRSLIVEIDEASPRKKEVLYLLEGSGFKMRSRHKRPWVCNCVFSR